MVEGESVIKKAFKKMMANKFKEERKGEVVYTAGESDEEAGRRFMDLGLDD